MVIISINILQFGDIKPLQKRRIGWSSGINLDLNQNRVEVRVRVRVRVGIKVSPTLKTTTLAVRHSGGCIMLRVRLV